MIRRLPPPLSAIKTFYNLWWRPLSWDMIFSHVWSRNLYSQWWKPCSIMRNGRFLPVCSRPIYSTPVTTTSLYIPSSNLFWLLFAPSLRLGDVGHRYTGLPTHTLSCPYWQLKVHLHEIFLKAGLGKRTHLSSWLTAWSVFDFKIRRDIPILMNSSYYPSTLNFIMRIIHVC